MKHGSIFLLILLTSIPLAASAAKTFKVTIDPGHGGADLGTTYNTGTTRLAEKDLALLVALETSEELRSRGHFVLLTREKDEEVSLPARTAMANKFNADVFLSIHLNSASYRSHGGETQGVETYILNTTTDASSRRLAQLENRVIAGSAAESTEQLDVALILKDLRLDANMPESKRLACAVQDKLISTSPRGYNRKVRNRGVKQALFHVLLGADMPSVLVEIGFLASANDRQILLSHKGRKAIARAIGSAIDTFKKEKELQSNPSNISKCKIN